MSSANTSVLAKKIERAKKAAPASSDLSDFVAAAGKAMQDEIAELVVSPLEATAKSSDARLPEALAEATDPGVYYWLVAGDGSPCALAVVAPGFAAALAERLLGGEFAAPAAETESSLLDYEMSGLLADAMSRAINSVAAKRTKTISNNTVLADKRGARSPAAAFADLDPMRALCVSLDLAYGDNSAPEAIRLFILTRFLDRTGVSGASNKAGDTHDAAWAQRLRTTILHTELPLDAVLGRIRTNIGELSRLAVGQVLDLEGEALNALEVTAVTDAGPSIVARARLGSYQSHKAIKLTTPIEREFIRDL